MSRRRLTVMRVPGWLIQKQRRFDATLSDMSLFKTSLFFQTRLLSVVLLAAGLLVLPACQGPEKDHLLAAEAAYRQGDMASAAYHYRWALRHKPALVEDELVAQRVQIAEAQVAFDDAKQMQSHLRFDEALERLATAKQLDPDHLRYDALAQVIRQQAADRRYELAISAADRDDLSLVESSLQSALKYEPGHTQAVAALELLRLTSASTDTVLGDSASVDIILDIPGGLSLIEAQQHIKSADWHAVKQAAEKALSMNRHWLQARAYLARANKALGNSQDWLASAQKEIQDKQLRPAVAQLHRAIAYWPDNQTAHDLLNRVQAIKAEAVSLMAQADQAAEVGNWGLAVSASKRSAALDLSDTASQHKAQLMPDRAATALTRQAHAVLTQGLTQDLTQGVGQDTQAANAVEKPVGKPVGKSVEQSVEQSLRERVNEATLFAARDLYRQALGFAPSHHPASRGLAKVYRLWGDLYLADGWEGAALVAYAKGLTHEQQTELAQMYQLSSETIWRDWSATNLVVAIESNSAGQWRDAGGLTSALNLALKPALSSASRGRLQAVWDQAALANQVPLSDQVDPDAQFPIRQNNVAASWAYIQQLPGYQLNMVVKQADVRTDLVHSHSKTYRYDVVNWEPNPEYAWRYDALCEAKEIYQREAKRRPKMPKPNRHEDSQDQERWQREHRQWEQAHERHTRKLDRLWSDVQDCQRTLDRTPLQRSVTVTQTWPYTLQLFKQTGVLSVDCVLIDTATNRVVDQWHTSSQWLRQDEQILGANPGIGLVEDELSLPGVEYAQRDLIEKLSRDLAKHVAAHTSGDRAVQIQALAESLDQAGQDQQALEAYVASLLVEHGAGSKQARRALAALTLN